MLKFSAPVREFKLQFSLGDEIFDTSWFLAEAYQEKLNALRSAAGTGRIFVIWREFKATGYQEIK